MLKLCAALLDNVLKLFAELHFPEKTLTFESAWNACLSCIAFESHEEAFKYLTDSNPGVFDGLLISDFEQYFSKSKTNFNGITKISFKNALEVMAKKKKTNLSCGEIDIDDKLVTDSLEKMSDKNDEDTGIFGTNYLADLREGKQPSSSSKVSLRTEMYLFIQIYECRKP